MDLDLGQLLRVQNEGIKSSSVSSDTLLSLVLAGKILKQDEVAEYPQVPAEDRIDFLFEKVQKKNSETIKAFVNIIDARFPTSSTRTVRKSEPRKWGEGECGLLGIMAYVLIIQLMTHHFLLQKPTFMIVLLFE